MGTERAAAAVRTAVRTEPEAAAVHTGPEAAVRTAAGAVQGTAAARHRLEIQRSW